VSERWPIPLHRIWLDVSLSSKDFSGDAIVHLLLHRLADLPNRTFSIVELDFSAQDLISTFTALHNGAKPEITEYTEDDYQRDRGSGMREAMRAGRTKGLAVGTDWPGEKVQVIPGRQNRSLEGWIKEYL